MNSTSFLYPQPCDNLEDENLADKIYFDFEEEIVEDNVRCIPMIVRFKLDACGIKLKLKEWSTMSIKERKVLAESRCADNYEIRQYREYLQDIILKRTGAIATDLDVSLDPEWADKSTMPVILIERLDEFNWQLPMHQWRSLNNLKRFVLLKLCREGHENRNFPLAMKEFGLV